MKLYTLDNVFIKETNKHPNNFTGIVEHYDGTKEWYFEGKLHRIDGPAIERFYGTKHWYINGKEVIEEEHDLLYSIMKLKGLM